MSDWPPPILEALYKGERDRAQELAAESGSLDVFEAAALGDAPRLEELLREDAALAGARTPDGFTALHYAAFFGSPESVRALVAAGADLEARSTNQEFALEATPLHSAAAAGRMDNAEALLVAGADPNARQHGGFTPLMEAEGRGDLDLAELLIRHGAYAGGGA
ncbi:MAG TPA: ankyrin repeat domain-containing protein [Gaiellaceae bacterium]|nr:ankyrin repeat domain-containing protein [Gaiellaceae bacterium]